MELNEAVSDYEMEPDNAPMKTQATTALQTQLDEWEDAVTPLVKRFDQETSDQALLLQLKDFYFRKK